MADFIIIAIVLVIVSLASTYVYRAKKQGKKCIGCPDGCSCSCNASCSTCAGCKSCEH